MGDETDVFHRGGRQRQFGGIDAAIAAIAEVQHGVVARAQLTALGLSGREIDFRVALGRLHRVHRGVFAVGHKRLTREGRWMAAILAGGVEAALSHRAAGACLGILPAGDGPIDVTGGTQRRSRDGLRFHHSALPADEVTVRDGIRVTSVPRTLLDLAAILPRRRLQRALNEAEVLRLTDPLSLPDLLDRYPRRRGTASIRAVVAGATLGGKVTRSELERRFLFFLSDHGLPAPQTNVVVDGFEVDCVWPAVRLVVELDGYAAHATRRSFEADRARDRALGAAGWRTVRVTERHLAGEPEQLAADLRRLVLAPSGRGP